MYHALRLIDRRLVLASMAAMTVLAFLAPEALAAKFYP
jgi:hypothetical protein